MKQAMEEKFLRLYQTASGLLVENFLNPVEYNGIRIDVNCGAIRTRDKARFFPYYVRNEHSIREKVLIDRYLPPNTPVIEFGGGIGYISSHINKVLDDGVTQVVVEPNPKNVQCNEKTRTLNGCDYSLLNGAYDPDGREIEFSFAGKFSRGSTQKQMSSRTIQVPGYSLSALSSEYDISEFVLVSDMEGGEFGLIDNELDILASNASIAIVEFHEFGEFGESEYVSKMESVGFERIDEEGGTYVFETQIL